MWPPLYSGHFKKSQSMFFNTDSPLKCGPTPLIRTLSLVPRVAGLEGLVPLYNMHLEFLHGLLLLGHDILSRVIGRIRGG